MKTFYVTATGNSLYVAKRIGGELCAIPQMIREGKSAFRDEAIGFVFPCYAFGIPRIVKDFIQRSTLEADYFFAVMTYGNMAASSLRELEKAGQAVGIRFHYTNEILMIDNYLPIFSVEKQRQNEASKQIEKNLKGIVDDIQGRQTKVIQKGVASVAVSRLVNHLAANHHRNGKDRKLLIQDSCNGCGVCSQVCPVQNIQVADRPEFAHKCEGCFACIHHCPQNAIHLKSEKSSARFMNQNVTLAEIIQANNQSGS